MLEASRELTDKLFSFGSAAIVDIVSKLVQPVHARSLPGAAKPGFELIGIEVVRARLLRRRDRPPY